MWLDIAELKSNGSGLDEEVDPFLRSTTVCRKIKGEFNIFNRGRRHCCVTMSRSRIHTSFCVQYRDDSRFYYRIPYI